MLWFESFPGLQSPNDNRLVGDWLLPSIESFPTFPCRCGLASALFFFSLLLSGVPTGGPDLMGEGGGETTCLGGKSKELLAAPYVCTVEVTGRRDSADRFGRVEALWIPGIPLCLGLNDRLVSALFTASSISNFDTSESNFGAAVRFCDRTLVLTGWGGGVDGPE